eukprot:6489710-Alexandrium_andersonii.AAC.1
MGKLTPATLALECCADGPASVDALAGSLDLQESWLTELPPLIRDASAARARRGCEAARQ